ncbi:hypothetical protein HOS07_gp34 [Cronobacter phage ESSI-2]|uniref:Uncharacterized protein n=1 Tax=Cronobacter phage ESSI-2 TaxID=947842 RepID=F1BUN0_9CAUD|nr:hypothetical protein HOS07_gp34 [Cronobacter phage ESSI-2]ADX32400.1 hypothetical protein [Cronobacter phage ESSI-2]
MKPCLMAATGVAVPIRFCARPLARMYCHACAKCQHAIVCAQMKAICLSVRRWRVCLPLTAGRSRSLLRRWPAGWRSRFMSSLIPSKASQKTKKKCASALLMRTFGFLS